MDEQLKARLVGAAVLVVAAVIFVPMILSGPGTGDRPEPGAQPSRPPALSPRVVPLELDRVLASENGEPSAPAPDAASRAAPEEAGAPAPAALSRAAPAPLPPPAPVASARREPSPPGAGSAESAAPAWVVQLGSFSNKDNAQGLVDRLVKKGYKAFLQTSGDAGAEVTRVLVGPDTSRDAAKARLPGLFEETKLEGIVTPHDG